MELISGEWIIGIIALLAGLIIGFIAGCKKSSSSQEKKQLLKQLIDTQQQLEKYRNQVSGYFNRTATLINDMTESYKNIHQHFTSGVNILCDKNDYKTNTQSTDNSSNWVTKDKAPKELLDPGKDEVEVVEPPLDYAPKKKPEDSGTLLEGYGLNNKNNNKSSVN